MEIIEYSDSKEYLYKIAQKYLKKEKFDKAVPIFAKLNGYKNSINKKEECVELEKRKNYLDGIRFLNQKRYALALKNFELAGNYGDSKSKIKFCEEIVIKKYEEACEMMEVGKYTVAISMFNELDAYKKTLKYKNKCIESIYNQAIYYMNKGDYEQSIWRLKYLKKYKNCEKLLKSISQNYKA